MPGSGLYVVSGSVSVFYRFLTVTYYDASKRGTRILTTRFLNGFGLRSVFALLVTTLTFDNIITAKKFEIFHLISAPLRFYQQSYGTFAKRSGLR